MVELLSEFVYRGLHALNLDLFLIRFRFEMSKGSLKFGVKFLPCVLQFGVLSSECFTLCFTLGEELWRDN